MHFPSVPIWWLRKCSYSVIEYSYGQDLGLQTSLWNSPMAVPPHQSSCQPSFVQAYYASAWLSSDQNGMLGTEMACYKNNHPFIRYASFHNTITRHAQDFRALIHTYCKHSDTTTFGTNSFRKLDRCPKVFNFERAQQYNLFINLRFHRRRRIVLLRTTSGMAINN